MAKKSKRVSVQQTQYERAVEFAKLNEDFSERFYPNGEPDWSDDNIRSEAARRILAFNVFRSGDDGRTSESLIKAFGGLGLNPANPYHWRFLIEFLAVAIFGTTVPKGRPKGTGRWNEQKKRLLSAHILEYFEFHNWAKRQVKLQGKMPDKLAIAKWIKNRHQDDYRHDPDEQIHREVLLFFKPFNAKLQSALQTAMGDK